MLNKGKFQTNHVPWNKGKHYSEARLTRMRDTTIKLWQDTVFRGSVVKSLKGNTNGHGNEGRKGSEQESLNKSKASLGKPKSDAHCKATSVGIKRKYATDEVYRLGVVDRLTKMNKDPNHIKLQSIGIKESYVKHPENRLKLSLHWTGDKNPAWTGGIQDAYGPEFTQELRLKVITRDEGHCKLCPHVRELNVHHIDYNKSNNELTNLITLCISCHMRTNYNREKWFEYFQMVINNT